MDMPLSVGSTLGSPHGDNTGAAPAISGDVALLLDWENLKESLRQYCNAQPNIKALLATARQHGSLAVARAYADWSDYPRLGVDAPNLVRNAIDPIYTIGERLKNSADIRLAVDAIVLCERSPQITTYVVGSGDGGLISVVNYLQLRGRKVVVIAVGPSLSGYLLDAADLTLRYEEAIEPLLAQSAGEREKSPLLRPSTPPIPTPPPATATPTTPPPTWEELAGWVVAILTAQGPGPYPLSTLAHQLKAQHGFTVTLVAMKFLQCMERIAETHPIRITGTPIPNSPSPTMSYFAELIVPPKAKKVKPPVNTTSASSAPPRVKPMKAKKAPPATAKPKIASPEGAAALDHAFATLPSAVVTARLKSKTAIARYPAVQLALQTQIGGKLSALGWKPGAFFAEAARRGLVQTAVLSNGTSKSDILLLPGDPIPTRA